jgi:transaldolase
MTRVEDLRIKLFADGADLTAMCALYAQPHIRGLTTNPTLMAKAGIRDYRSFCREVLETVREKPISFEVFSDDLDDMERQAREISSWASNVYVKIPITNTQGASTRPVIQALVRDQVRVNVTALTSAAQVRELLPVLAPDVPAYVSVFAGRVADTGRDPVPMMAEALAILSARPAAELLWASTREVFNIFQADAVGCPIITVTHELLAKLPGIGRDLEAVSLDTVRMFHADALRSGYTL